MSQKRSMIFSVTKKDLVVETFRSGGKGGQNQNKRDTGVRIRHPDSGAVAESREHRTQLQNKKAAFERLVQTPEFKRWHKIEAARRMGTIVDIDKWVDEQMHPDNLKIEYGPFEEDK